jgi:hypothetical protein
MSEYLNENLVRTMVADVASGRREFDVLKHHLTGEIGKAFRKGFQKGVDFQKARTIRDKKVAKEKACPWYK